MRFGEEHVDSKVVQIDHYQRQYGSSRWIAAYHRFVLRQAVALARLEPGMKVLDYGCGRQVLKGMLPPGVDYVGYDLVPALSDCEDPSAGKYDLVFAIQVLQYPDEAGLRRLGEVFSTVAPRLVVMLPSQNAFKRLVLDPLLGLKKDADLTFRSGARDVYAALGERFVREGTRNVFWVGEVTSWRRKGRAGR